MTPPRDEINMGDPINWEAPEPRYFYGLYSYTCECPSCGEGVMSNKGMLNPERRYRRHWWYEHVMRAHIA